MEVVEFLLDRLCDKKKARQRGQPGSGKRTEVYFQGLSHEIAWGRGEGR